VPEQATPLVELVTATVALEHDTLLATLGTPLPLAATLETAPDALTLELAFVQGLRGPPGPPGPDANALLLLSSGPLSALRVVRALDGEHVVAASALVRADAHGIIGVTRTSAGAAEEPVFVVGLGELEDAAWSFLPQRPVFVGATGELTQTLDPSWAFVIAVGVAMSATKVWVRVQAPTFVAREGG
jgi:hypothetical protein